MNIELSVSQILAAIGDETPNIAVFNRTAIDFEGSPVEYQHFAKAELTDLAEVFAAINKVALTKNYYILPVAHLENNEALVLVAASLSKKDGVSILPSLVEQRVLEALSDFGAENLSQFFKTVN